jgi:hypothetical protein
MAATLGDLSLFSNLLVLHSEIMWEWVASPGVMADQGRAQIRE